MAGSATLTTLPSRKTTNEPRMHAARMRRLRVAGDRCSILANAMEVAVAAYQIVKLEDVDDWLGDYPGEMRGITYAIGAEQVAITHRRMPRHTGSKGSYGHRHRTQEEIVFVLRGRLQFKLDDEIVELGRHDAIRIPPETVRGIWNDEPEDAEIVIVSRRIDDPSGDVESVENFWPE
jgi:mannose-6-phosphate isomerase-like protein (cupin superfamily)